jgi:hypothetical protein
MNDIIYLEADEEITSVIDKIRKSQNKVVILVIPRGGTMGQSIINLKLLMRSAKTHGKATALVSTDKITGNLANQLKISVFPNVSEAEKAHIKPMVEPLKTIPEELENAGPKVNAYKRYSLANLNAKADSDEEAEEEAPLPVEEEESDDEPQFKKRTIENYADETDYDEDKNSQNNIQRDEKELNNSENYNIKSGQGNMRNDKKHIKTEGSRKTFFAILITALFLIAVGAGIYFVPTAKAVVVLKTRDIDEKVSVVVGRDIKSGAEALSAPGKIIDLEKESTKTIVSTGKKNIGEKAKGTVTISNLYNFQSAIKLAKGTKIVSDTKEFILQSEVTIPVAKATAAIENNIPVLKTTAGTVDAEVLADKSGDEYNLSARKFNVTGFVNTKVFAESKVVFAGGTNKEVKIVTEEDLKKAETDSKAELLELAKKELATKATESSLKILEGQISSEIVSQEATKVVNDEADSFDFKIKVKFFVLGFLENDIKTTVTKGIESKIAADEMIISPEKSNIAYKVKASNIDNGEMELEATFTGKVGKKIDINLIKNNIKNKEVSSAKSYLASINGVDSSIINISPSFWQRTPIIANKITVEFDYKK